MEDGLEDFELDDAEATCVHNFKCLEKWMENPELPDNTFTGNIHCEHGVWWRPEEAIEEWQSGL